MKLVKEVGQTKYTRFGVIDTPCFPARYFGGVLFFRDGEVMPASNETFHFHRTEEAATQHAQNLLDYWLKSEKIIGRIP